MSARELLQRATGLDLSEAAAERAVAERMAVLGHGDSGAYLRAIGPDELKALIELVVVPESWMFRDPEAFAAVGALLRQRLTEAPARVLRILSIPCAGGEEPYSIAMALHDAGVARGAVRIEAIDLSHAAIVRARRGRYTRNAFRGRDLAFRDRHFTQDGAEYQINQALRDQVAFAQGNLLALDANAVAGGYDIVFCRNLLIYFDDATTASAIAKLRLLLADDGVLFAGYAEVPAFCSHGFAALRIPGAFALQKAEAAALSPAPAPARAPAPPATRARAARPAAAAPVHAPKPARPAAAASEPGPLLEQAARLAGQGDYAAAASACHGVLHNHPGAAEAYFILGMVSECEGKPGLAGDYWRRCVYLEPGHYEALCHLALLAEQTGDAAQAASLKQRAARVYQRRDNHAPGKQASR